MSDGYYLFVNQCEYSRWVSVEELRSTSYEAVEPILNKICALYGAPRTYKTDNGPPFSSYKFAELAKKWGFQHRKITPYWPRANAETESFMKKLGKTLRVAALSKTKRHEAIQAFMRVYNETPHSTTRVAPALLMFGHTNTSGIPAITLSADQLKEKHLLAQKNDSEAKERMKREYDARMRARECNIGIGSTVLVKQERKNKLMAAWDPNPYTVTLINGSLVTAKRTYPTRHEITRNSSFFKRYLYEDDDEKLGEGRVTPEIDSAAPLALETPPELDAPPAVETPLEVDTPRVHDLPLVIGTQRGFVCNTNHTENDLETVHQPVIITHPATTSLIESTRSETNATTTKQQNGAATKLVKLGRPTKEQSAANQLRYEEQQAEKREANPPQRASTRNK